MKNRGSIKDKIKRYKELKADIKYRELKLEEIEENIINNSNAIRRKDRSNI